MKPIFNHQPPPENRVDFGDAVISNAKNDCTKCLLKAEGCRFIVNSINCEIAIKRMKKILSEKEDEKDKEEDETVGTDMLTEEKKSLAEYLSSLASEENSSEENASASEEEDD